MHTLLLLKGRKLEAKLLRDAFPSLWNPIPGCPFHAQVKNVLFTEHPLVANRIIYWYGSKEFDTLAFTVKMITFLGICIHFAYLHFYLEKKNVTIATKSC